MSEIEEQSPQQKAYLHSKMNCNGCNKSVITTRDLSNFVIMFWEGYDQETGEPLIRDGVFEENGRIAILKACVSCGPKIKTMHSLFKSSGNILDNRKMAVLNLNDGPLKKMVLDIWPRVKASWRLEIGWEIMLPLLQKMKDEKTRKRLAISREDENVERIKRNARLH